MPHNWSIHTVCTCVGWSKPELLAGIPDGKGGYLPAIKQSPMGTTRQSLMGTMLPNGMNNEPPPLNKSFSGARVASTPFILQPRTQLPTSPFLSHPTSNSSVSYQHRDDLNSSNSKLLQMSRPLTIAQVQWHIYCINYSIVIYITAGHHTSTTGCVYKQQWRQQTIITCKQSRSNNKIVQVLLLFTPGYGGGRSSSCV